MPRREDAPCYSVEITNAMRSRGTGETVNRSELMALDVVPALIGSRFREVPRLRGRRHLYGSHVGVPFLAIQEGYNNYARDALDKSQIPEAVEGYVRGIHYGLEWTRGVQLLGGAILLTPGEIGKLDPGSEVKELEEGLLRAITSQEVAFNPTTYADFIRKMRDEERKSLILKRRFFNVGAGESHDPEIGREYFDLLVKMGRYDDAAWIAQKLGYTEKKQTYEEMAREEVDNIAGAIPFIDAAHDRLDP
jgi:hypothetical protein